MWIVATMMVLYRALNYVDDMALRRFHKIQVPSFQKMYGEICHPKWYGQPPPPGSWTIVFTSCPCEIHMQMVRRYSEIIHTYVVLQSDQITLVNYVYQPWR